MVHPRDAMNMAIADVAPTATIVNTANGRQGDTSLAVFRS